VLHESWEKFLKSTYAALLLQVKDEVSPPRKANFHKSNSKWHGYLNTEKYFRDYVHWSCRGDCGEALRIFRQELEWERIRVTHWNGMEWLAVSNVLAFCRHCIVHNEGRVADAEWTKLDKRQGRFVRTMMKKTILSDEERLLPPAQVVDGLIEAMMSFAYGLYVLLSERCGFEIDYALFKGEVT
jgi:hypothetical protein